MEQERQSIEIDPVCGMALDPDEALATSEHNGEAFYFCSDQCRQEFDERPDDYI